MPTEYQTINWISENFFDRNFWNIVDKDPQQLPSKATKAISCIELLSGEKTSKIDQLVSNLENQIEQLKEVRKIEIYNAVTGKIKVA